MDSKSQKIDEKIKAIEKAIMGCPLEKKKYDKILKVYTQKFDVLRDFYSQRILKQEKIKAREIMKMKDITLKKILDKMDYADFIGVIKKESKLGKITPKTKVLFLGSGPIPLTAILLRHFKKCKVDCVDRDKACVNISKRLIGKLNLSKDIKIFHLDAQNISSKGYDVIILAALIAPKEKIIKSILKKSQKDVRVLVRGGENLGKMFYSGINKKLIGKGHVKGSVRYHQGRIRSFLIEPK